MNSFPKFGFLLMLVVSSLVLACCKKDECKDKTRTIADFKIYEALEDDFKYSEVANGDTAYTTFITFSAQDVSSDVISYEWQIGNDPRTFSKKRIYTFVFR